ncbi:hypothetical protein [Aquimarina sp. 2201CG5-10]|uniref:hypothetical protein n=1 Tax=Aquimarina callyspongiae TaxID=3098150 RepID=UPI002AB4472E|nr:hypothetical protein [Aquimarina sp. 2201CG5-10]MDY8137099.1 hypothetical protein [Aquimarina sp. 2201CG5-10]
MKKIIPMRTLLIFIIISVGLTTSVRSQTVEEILDKYTEVTGGQENWDKITSMKIMGTAKLVSQNMELPMTRILMKDGRQYTSLLINGMSYVSIAYDGKSAWGSNQEMNPENKDQETTENLKRAIKEFPYPIHNWYENGFKAELLGTEEINGVRTFKIKFIKDPILIEGKEKQNVMIYYIHTEKYVPILTETEVMTGPSKGQVMKAFLEDYREVNGYWYPFLSTMKYGDQIFQVLQTENVELNIKINDNVFKMPMG